MRYALIFTYVLAAVSLPPTHASAVAPKPNKSETFKCLQENLERGKIVMIEPCIETIADPCDEWFRYGKYDLYSSCLKGLSFNWSRIINDGVARAKEELGPIIHKQVETELNRWRYALRRQCKRLPKLDYNSVHLKTANQRLCDVSVNAILAFVVLTRPEEFLEESSEQT